MTDITNPLDHLPRRGVSVNAGAVSIEQERAIAEARGQIQLAKMFPRSIAEAATATNCAARRERQRIKTHGAITSTQCNSVTYGNSSGPLRNTTSF